LISKKRNLLLRLLSLKDDKARILSASFQKEVDRYKRVVKIWKRKYNLPGNDPRYLTAPYNIILDDVLENVVGDYVEEFESYDEETNRKLKEQLLNPNFAEEEQKRLAEEIKNIFGS
jgi:hypothetical protein